MTESMYEISYEKDRDALIVRLPKEVDHHFSQGLKEVTESYAVMGQVRCIIFDFARTEFMDSTGIGILLGRYKFMRALGGTIALANVSGRIQRIMKIAGIYRIIPNLEWDMKEQQG